MKKGKLIVIDGADGSGKATQTELLVKRLRRQKYKVKTIDFPRYAKNFFGRFVGECLSGKYGNFLETDPHIASVLFAADRFESKDDIKLWLKEGYVVVADRYVSANQIHQGGKITNASKRKKFLDWLDEMEFGVFGLPRPDRIIYLDVPREMSDRLLARKNKDLHENNRQHLDAARKSAVKLVERNNHWMRIVCVQKGKLLSKETISDMIWQKVAGIIK